MRKTDKISAIIEARMTSSRLPGKVLLPADGKPMLEHLVDRLKQVQSIRDIVLATTINGADSCLEEFARKNGIECFRGSEQDVMDRVIGAADSVDADIIVDITGDCPIIDPLIIEQTIRFSFTTHVTMQATAIFAVTRMAWTLRSFALILLNIQQP